MELSKKELRTILDWFTPEAMSQVYGKTDYDLFLKIQRHVESKTKEALDLWCLTLGYKYPYAKIVQMVGSAFCLVETFNRQWDSCGMYVEAMKHITGWTLFNSKEELMEHTGERIK